MSTQAIEVSKSQPTAIQTWTSTSQIKARVQAIQQLMKDVLKEGVDYGKIPGMSKDAPPCLKKPGSEQILSMFQLAVDPVIEDLSEISSQASGDDVYRYRVTCRILNARTGEFLGAGVGECSTEETKYKWKRTYIQKEWDATDPDCRRMKYSRSKDDHGAWVDKEEMQIRQEPADLANTVLKMAKKRAQIDATLTVTGASSMFEQDLDEMEPGTAQEDRGRGRKKSQAKQEESGGAMCAECRRRNGLHSEDCKYHPKNQGKEQEKGVKAEAKPAEQAKQEEHPATRRVSVKIMEVEKNTKGKGTMVKMTVISDDHPQPYPVYCFEGSGKQLQADLLEAKGKTAIMDLIAAKSGEQAYLKVDRVLELDEKAYGQTETASPELNFK